MGLKLSKFWTSLFGFQIGDRVKKKYGKVVWEIFAVCEADWMQGKPRYYKLRRNKRTKRFGFNEMGEKVYGHLFESDYDFKEWEKVGES